MTREPARFEAFTIVTRKELAHARVLAASLARHHPGQTLRALILDDPTATFDGSGEPFATLRVSDLSSDPAPFHRLVRRGRIPSLLACEPEALEE